MKFEAKDFEIPILGECKIPSPMPTSQFVSNNENELFCSSLNEIEEYINAGKKPPVFELAGPRKQIFFEPSKLKCGIVTCGGLCPGLNDVIRAIVLSLHYHYGVHSIFGFRYGYEGLISKYGHTPFELTPDSVKDIHTKGGTILGSSRGPQDINEMVDTLERMNISILFTIGGDGTLRGSNEIAEEIKKRNLKISIIGIPKTIDNDISFIQQTFGFSTAVTETRSAIYSAHMEAQGAKNGVGLVKLMGRHSGFIAAYATLANSDVNYCFIPESKLDLDKFLESLKKRLNERSHAVIVVAEGAGQELMDESLGKDASGNKKLGDIGLFVKKSIKDYFDKNDMEVNIKYIDPSYIIRSMPANAQDSAFCLLLGYAAVHAGMTGRTNIVMGYWKNRFTHVPVSLAVSERKQVNKKIWSAVQSATGQSIEI